MPSRVCIHVLTCVSVSVCVVCLCVSRSCIYSFSYRCCCCCCSCTRALTTSALGLLVFVLRHVRFETKSPKKRQKKETGDNPRRGNNKSNNTNKQKHRVSHGYAPSKRVSALVIISSSGEREGESESERVCERAEERERGRLAQPAFLRHIHIRKCA